MVPRVWSGYSMLRLNLPCHKSFWNVGGCFSRLPRTTLVARAFFRKHLFMWHRQRSSQPRGVECPLARVRLPEKSARERRTKPSKADPPTPNLHFQDVKQCSPRNTSHCRTDIGVTTTHAHGYKSSRKIDVFRDHCFHSCRVPSIAWGG